ncbi:hypothetical protein KY289_020022 [Solanum tuberosum]|nr:hypothetical protein KY289_020022 [Solanum tuberosum]
MKNVWLKLRALKPLLKKLNNREFKNVRQQIDNVRIELKNLEKWSLIEENIVKQKSRARWIKLGDSNTKYFSAVMKERTQRKQISEIMVLSGDIQREIVDLYMSLMVSTATVLPAIDQLVMRRGPTLTIAQQTSLRTEVTDQEILDSLHAWPVIHNDVMLAVKELFHTGKLFRAVNCTTITLVPKVDNPTTVKDYRPIACCTLLYKLISKVLPARLQEVIASIICEA